MHSVLPCSGAPPTPYVKSIRGICMMRPIQSVYVCLSTWGCVFVCVHLTRAFNDAIRYLLLLTNNDDIYITKIAEKAPQRVHVCISTWEAVTNAI